jgi:MtN3 and saliva related transmembrane protein
MPMPLPDIIGFVAGFGTTFAALPDLIAMLKRRSCEGMNPTMAAIMGTFQIVWVYYGMLVESRPVIVWNMIAVAINFLVVGAYLYFASCSPGHAKVINGPGSRDSPKRSPP